MTPDRINHVGKGSVEETLPHRAALTRITNGDPADRSLGQYAKATPGLTTPSPNAIDMATKVVG